jgi:hypothetical protein
MVVENAQQAEDLAIEWQHWMSGRNLTWSEMAEWSEFFTALGEKYDLLDTFQENGII